MISLLAKLFIKDRKNIKSPDVRSAYGVLCGVVGIILNIVLCIIKLTAAALTGSVSVAADAFNNLGDAGSSLITLIGFKLASQKPDPAHPFGHGRIEYLSALIVSMLIVLLGFELGKESISAILAPSPSNKLSIVAVVILSVSIIIKLYIFLYNRVMGKRLSSQAMLATATDSISDCISTTAVLVCAIVSPYVSFSLDGWCGLAVSVFILFSGIKSVKETMDPLLGTPPEKEFVDDIQKIVMSYPEIVGIHDLIVHNYGPGRIMISLHAEVSQSIDILVAHDIIDNAENKLATALSCSAVIHLDPISTEDENVNSVKRKTEELAKAIDPEISIHDFRMVVGDSHTNLIFDMSVPYTVKKDDAELTAEMSRLVKIIDSKFMTVINVDREYSTKGS